MNCPSTLYQRVQTTALITLIGLVGYWSLSQSSVCSTTNNSATTTIGLSNHGIYQKDSIVPVENKTNKTNEEHNHQDPGLSCNYSLRSMTGTWIGNMWIPPSPWKLHSVDEIRVIFQGLRILWLGDSLGRRTSMTLFSILNQTTITTETDQKQQYRPPSTIGPPLPGPQHIPVESLEHDIGLNHDVTKESCKRPWSHQVSEYMENWTTWDQEPICRFVYNNDMVMVGDVTFLPTPKLSDVRKLLTAELASNSSSPIVANFNVIIVALGAWENIVWKRGRRKIVQEINHLFQKLIQRYSDTLRAVIWRTGGWPSSADAEVKGIIDLNQAIVDDVEKLHENSANKKSNSYKKESNTTKNNTTKNPNNNNTNNKNNTNNNDDNNVDSDKNTNTKNTSNSNSRNERIATAQRPQVAAAQKISYVDWASTMVPRSFGSQRIAGDSNVHYGLEARLVLIQMITNHLQVMLNKEHHENGF